MSIFNKEISRITDLYQSYKKEFEISEEDEEGILDISTLCDVADSVPYLLKQISELSSQLDNSLDYGYRSEGKMKDMQKEIDRLKDFEDWYWIANNHFPAHHRVINHAWVKSKNR